MDTLARTTVLRDFGLVLHSVIVSFLLPLIINCGMLIWASWFYLMTGAGARARAGADP